MRSSAGSRSMKSIDKVSKGSGRRSSKSLAGSRKSSKSKRSSEEAVKSSSGLSKSMSEVIEEECLDTIYLIEAVVLDDSWPLRMDEWRAVDILKEEMLYRSTLRESTSTGKKSYQSGVKYSQYSNSEYAVEPPYWVMQVIYNSDDSVQFSKDTRREREIVKMKKKWYKMDSLRYDISQDLRLLYLLDTRIINENLPGDIAILRSLDPNVFAGEILPPYDISEFMTGRRPPPARTDENLYGEGSSEFNNVDDWEKTNEDESLEAGKSSSGESSDALWEEEKRNPSVIDTNFLEQLGEEDGCQICVVETKISHDDARRLKTNEDFENDILDEQRILDEFAVKHDNMVEEMNNFVAEQTVNFEQLEDWFNGRCKANIQIQRLPETKCREDTAIIMEYALSLKAEYIQNVLDAIEKAKPKEEKAEKKKDKKDKGKKKK
ncbi:hypothetical protein NQ317_003920 [Molorchus minor]|uniref:Uncharacterized protein n=1 Tax=Molorchus minor TaxID=1323400 RepID=A0ABQ9J8H4_9CUCU|nr:hypothetical protein NQ317_003920 [Molorchus minor]